MPYNKSVHVVVRMQRYLDDMATNRRNLSWPSTLPNLAGKIREALHAAQHHPEYKQYHSLKAFFRIRSTPGFVEAEYLGPKGEHVETYTPEAMTVEEAVDVTSVVGACIMFQAKADELRFPNVKKLTDDDCKALYLWGQGENPQWHLINHEEAGVTMTRKRGVDELFLWRPA